MKPTTFERKLTINELAERWGWNPQKVRKLVEHKDPTKRLPHVKIGGRVFFEPSELEAYLEARRRRGELEPEPAEARSREQSCADLGIPVEHRFS